MRLNEEWGEDICMDRPEDVIIRESSSRTQMRQRKARNYESYERGETQNERADTECKTESWIYRTEL